MGVIDPERSFSTDSLEKLLIGKDSRSLEPKSRETLVRLWHISSTTFPRSGWKSAVRRLGFMLLALPHLKRLGRWLRCTGNPILAAEMQSSPWVYRAIHRPYVNKNWSLVQRLEAIEQHYLALLDGGSLLNIAGTQYFDLLQLGPEYLDLRIVVDRPKWMRAEGEISISLFHQAHRIYSAMFLITGNSACRRLVIGAFQGWSGAEAKDVYVRLTHALHGLRPRDFLVNVLQIVATSLGCAELWGIADDCHRGTHAFVRSDKHVSYDEVWREHGGKPNGQGFFVMPTALRMKDIAEVPSKKRAQYRRRYKLLDEVRSRIQRSFADGDRYVQEHERGAGSPLPEVPAPCSEMAG